MDIPREHAQQFLEILQAATHVRCVCHRSPDGDAAGSLLAIALLIEQNTDPPKPLSLHCRDSIPALFHFLPGAKRVQALTRIEEGDAVIFLDCAEPKLTEMEGSQPEVFQGAFPTINIDHHPDNPRYATVNIVESSASSTCEILLWLADMLQWKIDPGTATCLLTGLYTDTGGLLHGNTHASVYRAAAKLLRSGASLQVIVKEVFRKAPLSTLKLWGRVLEKIMITEEGGAIAAVSEEDFRASGAGYAELSGAIDYVNAVPGMRFSLILSEREGKVKGSLRTLRDDVDVSLMASRLQGGGHRKAAGFALPGKLRPEVRWKVVEEEMPAPLHQSPYPGLPPVSGGLPEVSL